MYSPFVKIVSMHPHAVMVIVVKYIHIYSYNGVNCQIILACGCTGLAVPLILLWLASRARVARST